MRICRAKGIELAWVEWISQIPRVCLSGVFLLILVSDTNYDISLFQWYKYKTIDSAVRIPISASHKGSRFD